MNTKQTQVSIAVSGKVANVAKGAKKAGKAHLHQSPAAWVKLCTTSFAQYLTVDDSLAQMQFAWKAARIEARESLRMAHTDIGDGQPWQDFLSAFADSLVTVKVCSDRPGAQRLISNALIALKLTGRGTRKGGKRKGAGRKETTATGTAKHGDAARIIVSALAYVVKMQEKHIGDSDLLEDWGGLAVILGSAK